MTACLLLCQSVEALKSSSTVFLSTAVPVCLQGNKVPNTEMGYPGGVFDPLGKWGAEARALEVS